MEQRKQEVIEAVISKAWEDASFRAELIADPVKTIEQFTSVKVAVPEGKTLIFLDQTDKSKIYVNIPAEPELENIELTEKQLEAVVGGGQKIWGDLVNSIFPNLKDCITF